MADSQYIIVDTQNQQARPVKLHDNGDGTYSISTYSESGGGSSSPSSSIGGGNSVYSNVQGDFTATANNGAKTITFSGYASAVLSAVLANVNFLKAVIMRRSSAGVVDTLPLTNVSFSSNVLTLSDMAANFAAGDTVAVYVTGPDKGFDPGNDQWEITLKSLLYGEDYFNNLFKVEQRYSYYPPISTATTTTLKTGAGFIHQLRIVGGTLGNVTVYDSTTGSGSLIVPTVTPVQGQVLIEDVVFSNGLTIVTAAATIIVGSGR